MRGPCEQATESIVEPYGPAMRVLEFTYEVMAPAKDEQKGDGARPFVTRFNRPTPSTTPTARFEPDKPPPAVLDKDGTPYVETD